MTKSTETKKDEAPAKKPAPAPAAAKASPASDVAAFDPEEGERARNETMKPGPLKAKGQTTTASKAKNG